MRRAHSIPVPRRSPSANRPLKVVSRCFALAPEGRPSGPSPPPCAVAGPTRGRKTNGYALPISDVYEEKSIYPSGDHGRGSLLAPGVFTPGTKPDRGPTHTRTRTAVVRGKIGLLPCVTALSERYTVIDTVSKRARTPLHSPIRARDQKCPSGGGYHK